MSGLIPSLIASGGKRGGDHLLSSSGSPDRVRLREESRWVYSDVARPAIVERELFDAAQARLRAKARPRGPRKGRTPYLLSGFVRCSSGHAPRAMFGRKRFDYTYLCCSFGAEYGREAAAQIEHPAWLNVREDRLSELVERFFAERLFGEMRMDKLAAQLDSRPKAGRPSTWLWSWTSSPVAPRSAPA